MTRTIQQLFDLTGKTALITGGSRGLGLQMAHALGEAGDSALRALDEANERLLARAKPTLTPLSTGHLALDFDVFTLDNSGQQRRG